MSNNIKSAQFSLPKERVSQSVGCQCKLPGTQLHQALTLANFTQNLAQMCPEDSAIIHHDKKDLLLSVDFGATIGTDFNVAGEIAGLHALSDLFVANGKPLGALAITVIEKDLPTEATAALLQGAQRACKRSGCQVLGGHTMLGDETIMGLAVLGAAKADHCTTKIGAQPGDALLISKPIGTGHIIRGWRNGHLNKAAMQSAVETMLQSNAQPAAAALKLGVHAITDITGFGFLGHLAELLANNLGATIVAQDVPVLPAASQLPAALLDTRWIEANIDYIHLYCRLRGNRLQTALLTEPQTNGPVLIAAAQAEPFVEAGFIRVGEVTQTGCIEVV